jgi:hypothetical protein
MPAIHPPRLRQQVEELVVQYADADRFSRLLKDLFIYYGEQTKRANPQTKQTISLPSGNVPLPVLREVVNQMAPYAENAPHAVLNLCRALWKQPLMESRQLASMLVGKLPVTQMEQTLQTVEDWAKDNHEDRLLESMAVNSLRQIEQEAPEELLARVHSWLALEDDSLPQPQRRNLLKLGLSALVPFASDPNFQNLPRLYTLLTPHISGAPKVLRPYLLDVLLPLARRSPQEVAYLLRTELTDNHSQQVVWLARRTMEALPEENRERLRGVVGRRKRE